MAESSGSWWRRGRAGPDAPDAASRPLLAPTPHVSGARPPNIPRELIPKHVAIVMDGNGRWAKERGLPRTAGHEAGEGSLLDVVEGALELGIEYLSAYAFSTENWKRSPDEVRFLMGFNRDVIRRRRDQLHEMGVRIRWVGRRPRLWGSVIAELERAEELTASNSVMTLAMCVNYGGRAEIADAAAALAVDVRAGLVRPEDVDEAMLVRYLDEPDMPDVDLFVRSSGEQRTSNFLLWQSAYAEMVFLDTLWPDFDRLDLWHACEIYADRDRRYGGAVPNEAPVPRQDLPDDEGSQTTRLGPTRSEPTQELQDAEAEHGHVDDQAQEAAAGADRGPRHGGQPGQEHGDDDQQDARPRRAEGQAEEQQDPEGHGDQEGRQHLHAPQHRAAGVLEAGAQAPRGSRGRPGGGARGLGARLRDGSGPVWAVHALLGHVPDSR